MLNRSHYFDFFRISKQFTRFFAFFTKFFEILNYFLLLPKYQLLMANLFSEEQGATFQGTLFHPATRDHSRVAVKALYLNMATPESGRKFAIEAALMAQFQHVNVCAFYGVIYSSEL